jgi:hypothetical protein
MISTTVRPLEEYDIRFDNSCRVFVGGASPSFITTLKQAVNEDRELRYEDCIPQKELSISL